MKLSYNLLKEFVKVKVSPEKLAQALTEHAFEVEGVKKMAPEFSGVVTAKVLEVQKHPNADRLRVVKLDLGGKIVEPVVCGAFNFEAGDMVALALPGAQIAHNIHSEEHESFTLQKAKIRGIESQGMVCAAFELGLSEELGEGIMVLDKSVRPGIDLKQLYSGNDVQIEVSLPANRPDLHSHLGIARETAAVLNVKFKEPAFRPSVKVPKAKQWRVEVKDKVLCPKYYGLRLSGVKVGPSPKFIQDTLATVGLRPVNNVVDITNFVMLEFGQPLHAFDANKIKGHIIVRRAKRGEKFEAINHKAYELDDEMLVIADEQKALALAGVMGGVDSEINDQTTDLVLEAANFDQYGVRRTSKKLGLRSDSSALFEKGLHPELVNAGLYRAAELLVRYAGAQIGALAAFETKSKKPAAIKFTIEEINRLLGADFSLAQVVKFLSRYQVKVKRSGRSLVATPPWWRSDLATMPDLAEEVLKLYGYNNVKPQSLMVLPVTKQALYDRTDLIRDTKDFWARLGFFEVQNYSFVSENDINRFGETRPHIEIENPLSSDQRFLKRHLLIPMLKNVALNQRNSGQFNIFEIGKQYLGFENEPTLLSAILFSKTAAVEKLVSDAKASALEYLKSLGLAAVEFSETDQPWLSIKLNDNAIGLVGTFQADILKNFDIDGNAVFIKLELDKLAILKKDILFEAYSRFPSIQRDVSIVVSKDIKWDKIESLIKPISPLVTRIELFEASFLSQDKSTQEFHKNLEKQGKKNLGIRLIFQAPDRTLTEGEVIGVLDKITQKLRQELQAEIR